MFRHTNVHFLGKTATGWKSPRGGDWGGIQEVHYVVPLTEEGELADEYSLDIALFVGSDN